VVRVQILPIGNNFLTLTVHLCQGTENSECPFSRHSVYVKTVILTFLSKLYTFLNIWCYNYAVGKKTDVNAQNTFQKLNCHIYEVLK